MVMQSYLVEEVGPPVMSAIWWGAITNNSGRVIGLCRPHLRASNSMLSRKILDSGFYGPSELSQSRGNTDARKRKLALFLDFAHVSGPAISFLGNSRDTPSRLDAEHHHVIYCDLD